MNELLDRAATVRQGDEIDPVVVSDFVKAHVPGLQGIAAITQFKGGASNLTYHLDFGTQQFILRRPPVGTKAKSAHDMHREFTIMQRLKPVYPYVPEMIAFCNDHSLVGSDFYVMEKLKGIIPRANLPKGLHLPENTARKLCVNVIDKLVELHQVDYQAAGLQDIGKGNGYVRRQISGWTDRYIKARTENVPSCERVMQWLHDNMPEDVATCVIHNDFRFDNVVLDPNDITRVIGVLDWEMATLGDPLMDLGNSLAYWVEAQDMLPLKMTRRQPTHLKGMLTRDEVVRYYCEKMGFKQVDFTYYRIYGLFRLAVIVQQIYYRYYHKQTTNPQFKDFHKLVRFLNHYCEVLLDNPGAKNISISGKLAIYLDFFLSYLKK